MLTCSCTVTDGGAGAGVQTDECPLTRYRERRRGRRTSYRAVSRAGAMDGCARGGNGDAGSRAKHAAERGDGSAGFRCSAARAAVPDGQG